MLTITSALVAEHRQFCDYFDQIEAALPGLSDVEAIRRLACHVDRLLRSHAAAEEDLVLLLLDPHPEQKRRCDRFYTEHQEIDAQLTQASQAVSAESAAQLLRAAIAASRRHFRQEERVFFPIIERVAEAEQLARLGLFWSHRRQSMALA